MCGWGTVLADDRHEEKGRWLLRYFRLGRTVKGLLRPGGKESVPLVESLLEERQKKDGAEDASAPGTAL